MDEIDQYLNNLETFVDLNPRSLQAVANSLQEISDFFGKAIIENTPQATMVLTIDPIEIRAQGKALGLSSEFIDGFIRSRIKLVK